MSIDSTWLRCPNCFSDLEAVSERVFGCADGHRFDRSKHGYLTLLPPRAPRTLGDDREMLSARAELLGGGTYARIAEALVAELLDGRSALDAARGLRVADLGCGTGYYSERLRSAIPGTDILLADRSPDAVRMALRAVPSATGVVLDVWRPLPIRDASVDVILDVFAPRNPSEFARILRPGGRLLVVVPTASHLSELRESGGLIDIPAEKAATVSAQLQVAGFMPLSGRRIEYGVEADAHLRMLIAGMGPSSHHAAALAPIEDDVDTRRMSVSVDVLAFDMPGS
ncbi:ubiquinone biosynthesis protein [Agromyces luteolus]|uniref:Methyltransferase domain-containing protein n=1 Tax=Agromyces luteolus TaxID=88373 RepID=A0A7C9LBZ7_9MICO|nr:methyltransferase domain-containing protein [Agromyces luteolus]MUN05511.1 methyltransferase domain-containing protein [Agromyces luteolus]GLK27616.1 ubiquinone biosynthesis protein [Agromyces luteolus]